MTSEFMRERLIAETHIDRLIAEFKAEGNADKLQLLQEHLSHFIALEQLTPLRSELLQISIRTRALAARCGWTRPPVSIRESGSDAKHASQSHGWGAGRARNDAAYVTGAKIAAAPNV